MTPLPWRARRSMDSHRKDRNSRITSMSPSTRGSRPTSPTQLEGLAYIARRVIQRMFNLFHESNGVV